jgi:hypothetical protein
MKNESPCNQYNCNYVFRYAVFEELLTVMCIVESVSICPFLNFIYPPPVSLSSQQLS